MNIYGIGTDIVNIKRIRNSIQKNKKKFKKRIYTDFEIKTCEKRKKNNAECFAKRFAASSNLLLSRTQYLFPSRSEIMHFK